MLYVPINRKCCLTCTTAFNVNKIKEMVVTFSNKQRDLAAAVITTIHRKPIGIVVECKYLDTIFDNLLKFASNTEEIQLN